MAVEAGFAAGGGVFDTALPAVPWVDPRDCSGQECSAGLRAWQARLVHDEWRRACWLLETARARADVVQRWPEPDPRVIAAELGWSVTMAAARLETARGALERLPRLGQAMCEGWLEQAKVAVFVAGCRDVTDEQATVVVEALIEVAPKLGVHQLQQRVAAAVDDVDPLGAQNRRNAAVARSRVSARVAPSGAAEIHGLDLDPGMAEPAFERIVAIADVALERLRAAGSSVGPAKVQAQVYLRLLHGCPAGEGDLAVLEQVVADLTPPPAPPDAPPGGDGPGDPPDLDDGDPHDSDSHGGPQDDGPQDGGPQDGGPDGDGPNDGRPDHGGSDHSSPDDGSRDDDGPHDVGPDDRGPHDGSPQDGLDDGCADGGPADGGPQDGSDDGGPEDSGPEDSGPDDHGPAGGAPMGGVISGSGADGSGSDAEVDRRGRADAPTEDAAGAVGADGGRCARGVGAAGADTPRGWQPGDPEPDPPPLDEPDPRVPTPGQPPPSLAARWTPRGLTFTPTTLRTTLATVLGLGRAHGQLRVGTVTGWDAHRAAWARTAGQFRVSAYDADGALEHVLLVTPPRRADADPRYRRHVVELTAHTTEIDALDPDGTLIGIWAELARRVQRALAAARQRPPDDHPAHTSREARNRFPGAELTRWIHARDRTCRFPMCTVPAVACPIDHTHDHTLGGPTQADNLGPLSVGDHLRKHDPTTGWTVRQTSPGRFVWTAPTGTHHVVEPDPYRPLRPIARDRYDHGITDTRSEPRPQRPWRPRTNRHGHLTEAQHRTLRDIDHRRRQKEHRPPNPLDDDPPF